MLAWEALVQPFGVLAPPGPGTELLQSSFPTLPRVGRHGNFCLEL